MIRGFIILSVVFGLLERFTPSIRGQKTIRNGFFTDLVYWFFTPLVTKTLTRASELVVVLAVMHHLGLAISRSGVEQFVQWHRPTFEHWPLWLQGFAVLLLADLIGYWTHRMFHGRLLWRFHAVHHASKELDWLSSVRLHPVNDVVSKVAVVIPLLLIGFDRRAIAPILPVLTLWAIAIHANVSWTFGPLRYLVATPAFHRWHHTSQDEGLDTNFAGLFPFWDLIFGTFHVPRNRVPTQFGVVGDAVPDGFFRQMLYPFMPGLFARPAPASAQLDAQRLR